jgi:predicted phosphate transport protein (TIGR00153 family)
MFREGGEKEMVELIPKERRFFDLFKKEAMGVLEAAQVFKEMVFDYTNPQKELDKLVDLEKEGDITTHEIIDNLNRTFVTPFDREDILSLSHGLDDILDFIEATAGRMVLYRISETKLFEIFGTGPYLKRMAESIYLSVNQVYKAVDALSNLRKNYRRILDHCIEINSYENEVDGILREAISNLFENEKDPISLIKWKEIYESAETTTDRCEDVANILESIVVKHL